MITFLCPGCGLAFSVDDDKAGKTGKCPKCSVQFEIPAAESPISPVPNILPGTVEIDPCPRCQTRLSAEVGDLGKNVECPTCKTVYEAIRTGGRPALKGEDEPRSRSKDPERYDDDEDDGRDYRRRPSRRNRSSLEPHRGGTVLTMVLVGFFCCAILTIAGTIMATIDLGKMKRGEMDPEGKGMTQAAQIVGFIGIGLFVLSMIFNVVMIAFGK